MNVVFVDLKKSFFFFGELEPLYRDLAIVQYFCGGRIGETLGIQKSCIDFKNRQLLIRFSSIHNSSKIFWYLSDLTKTGEERFVHITDSFVTIFNWYKESEEFEKEALHLTNPIKKKHKKLGFIKPTPDKRKKITLEHALIFFTTSNLFIATWPKCNFLQQVVLER